MWGITIYLVTGRKLNNLEEVCAEEISVWYSSFRQHEACQKFPWIQTSTHTLFDSLSQLTVKQTWPELKVTTGQFPMGQVIQWPTKYEILISIPAVLWDVVEDFVGLPVQPLGLAVLKTYMYSTKDLVGINRLVHDQLWKLPVIRVHTCTCESLTGLLKQQSSIRLNVY